MTKHIHVVRIFHTIKNIHTFNMDANLANRTQRLVYLLTYSRADPDKVNCRETFATMIVDTWQRVTTSQVIQYVVCQEKHQQNDGQEGRDRQYHYHMALKLDKRSRWLQVREALHQRFGIEIYFSDNHASYYSAYRYCLKGDETLLLSPQQ